MGVSFLGTSIYTVAYIIYGVTLEIKYWTMANLVLTLVGLAFVMALAFKPKRTDVGYMRFLYFHFFAGPLAGEDGLSVGHFRLGLPIKGVFALFRIPLWYLLFLLGLKLRGSAAKLPPRELSDFLCQTVLAKGTVAMGTMLFFSFEAISCFISKNSLDSEQCTNTSYAAKYLSVYVVVLTTLSIASKSVPKSVQRETAWELSAIASLKGLKWWQQIQGGLAIITAISSLYLLSFLGVEGDENSMVLKVGAMGWGSICIATIINMIMLIQNRNSHQRNSASTELPTNQRSARGFPAGAIEENAIGLALV